MAIAAATVWEVRTSGSNDNGGGYSTGGTDYSQQDSAQLTVTGVGEVRTSAPTELFDPGGGFTSAMVGNIVNIVSGTNVSVGRYQITAYTDSTKVTVDRTMNGTAFDCTDATFRVGGAVASPGTALIVAVGGNDVHIKSGTYTVTSTSTNVTNGCLSLPAAPAAANLTKIIGYGSTRLDGGTKPIIIADGVITTFTLLASAGNGVLVENIEFDGNSRTSSRGLNIASHAVRVKDCTFKNFTNSAINGGSSNHIQNCYATGCATQAAFIGGRHEGCVARSNTISGFSAPSATSKCISASNTGGSSDGFVGLPNDSRHDGNVAYANGRYGFASASSTFPVTITNCVAVGNGAYGFHAGASPHEMTMLFNCAGYNNTSGDVNTTTIAAGQQFGFVTLTADPFTDAANGDFRLNNTAGGGAALRAVAYPTSFPGISSTTNFGDIGAAQVEPSAAGGLLRHPGMTGGFTA